VKPYAFHPAAEVEYTQAAEYYGSIAPELGVRFYDEIERLIAHCQAYGAAKKGFSAESTINISKSDLWVERAKRL
jgi:hypothetical protein